MHATLFPNPARWMDPRKLLASGAAALLLLLNLHCGGGATATVAGPPPLTLTVEAPGEGVVVPSAALRLRGRVSQASATVAINRQAVAVQPDGAFEGACQLQEGRNTLTIEAWTEATVREGRGSGLLPPSERAEARVVRTVTFERPPLLLTVAVPAEGATFTTPTLQTTGVVSEPDATLTLNGQPVPLGREGAFSATVDLQTGTNTFTYRATGAGQADRTATATRTVTRQALPPAEGPTVTLTEPVEGTLTNAARIRVSGRVSDPSAALQVNGQATPMDATGAFSLDLAPPEGPLTVTVVATNAQGLTGSDRRSVVIDRTPPVITLARPVPALVNTRTLDLEGRVDDPTALLTLNAQGIPLAPDGAFQARYGLAEGPNHLAFRAVDPAGNVGTLELDTVCDSVAPGVRFLSPHDGFTTNDVAVMVRGTVDDPSASLVLQGRATALDSDGNFEATLSAEREGVLAIRAEATDAAGHQGQATLYVRFDFTPPVLAWADPTPAEGSRLATGLIPAAVVLSESALTAINGQGVELEPGPDPAMPFRASAELEAQEGQVVLTASAVDGAGNRATLSRALDVGLTAPRIQLESPVLDPEARFTTANPGATLVGRVLAPDFVRPLTFTVNGRVEALDAEGRFQVPVTLAQGSNPFNLRAVSRFGQAGALALTLLRTSQDAPPEDPVAVQIDWPQHGFASGVTPILVKGRVNKAGVQVTLAGLSVAVDPQTLQFSGRVPLTPGPNRIVALGTDADGRSGSAEVQGTYLVEGAAGHRWDHPVHGSRSVTRRVAVSGQADQPGILAVLVNGVPMSLSGEGAAGRFEGQVDLATQGRNTLLLEVRTLAGEIRTEQREVIFQPELPRLRLLAPDAARPGEVIALQVAPEPGTRLVKADLSWNGRFLATVEEPFAPASAQVPSDAAVGGRIAVEALGTDAEGATVTARSQVTVYGQGALMVEAFDDRLGLPFTDQVASAAVEGGEAQALDARGRAALATALPQNWVTVTKPGFTPVWRAAGLTVGSAQSVVDARLTPLEPAQQVGPSGFAGPFGGGALNLSLPAGALASESSLSVTPLSGQGLPALPPLGWSPLSAWWIQIDGAALAMPATADLKLPAATPALPGDATFAWVRWDAQAHAWVVLAAPLSASGLGSLPLPAPGGYALVIADSAPTAPPSPVAGSVLPAFTGTAWHEGLPASGAVDPSLLPTVEAVRGARATARFELKFQDGFAVPSGAPIQADVLESYLRVDQALIEPEGFSQDAVATRWMLEVIDGKPLLSGISEGIGLRLPLRMSRAFGEQELVEGRIAVGFYHDGVQVAQSGTGLVGASGGTVSRDGVSVTLPAGALSGTALVRLSVEAGDLVLWPELADKGLIARSFQVDIVGTLRAGMGLSFEGLSWPEDARPLLVQRRVLRGQRLVLAVGGLQKVGSAWTLSLPPGGNALLEGGAFAVLLPDRPWDWISGTTTVPAALAQPLVKKLGAAAGLKLPPAARTQASSSPGEEVAVADAVVEGDFLAAASGPLGAFAVPVALPAEPTQPVTLRAARRDLGVSGSLQAPAPSSGHTLRLAAVPFRVLSTVPAPGDTAPVATVAMILLSAPTDPARLGGARLLRQVAAPSAPPKAEVQAPPQAKIAKRSGQKASPSTSQPRLKLQASSEPAPEGWVEVPVWRILSQDGRTLLLTPENPLERGASYRLVAEGLASLAGEVAPPVEAAFTTAAVVQPPPVDFSRIKLGYPDATFNVPVTVPEGAIPPFAALEVEAPAMGSVFTGQMNPRGDLSFTLRASLGERLNIRVQLKDGRVFEGHLSRYEAADGRVMLGIDGGRVDSADGLASATLPEGALEGPAEIQVSFLRETPMELDPELAAHANKILGQVRLSADREVRLLKRPVLEIKAPANASTLEHEGGLGAYAVFDRVEGFEEDGSPCVYFQMGDTAAVSPEGQLRSMGGLPQLPPEGNPIQAVIDRTLGEGRAFRSGPLAPQAHRGGTGLRLKPGSEASPLAGSTRQEAFFVGGLFNGLLSALFIDAGPHYIAGFAEVRLPGQEPKPAIGAFVNFAPVGTPIRRGGQMLQRTQAPAGSYLLASFLTDELVRGGGQIMGIDADYGVRDFVAMEPFQFSNGRYYRARALRFVVDPMALEDKQPPYLSIALEAKPTQGEAQAVQTVANASDELTLVIHARDNRTPNDTIFLQAWVDHAPLPACQSSCEQGANRSPATPAGWDNGVPVFRFPLGRLGEGRHTIVVNAFDAACNKVSITKEITVVAFGEEGPALPGAPTASLVVQGDLEAVRPDTSIRVKFSEPVRGILRDALVLERLENGAAVREEVMLHGRQGEVLPSHRISEVALLTPGRLRAGTRYQVRWSSDLKDDEGLAPVGGPLGFATASHARLPVLTLSDSTGGEVAAVGNMVYVKVNDRIQAWIFEGGQWLPQGTVGVDAQGGFFGQDIVRMRAFTDVPLEGGQMGSLLLVTTKPKEHHPDQQNVLWGFRACGLPELLFAVSLGQGSAGYSPAVDCRDGVIAVGRLTSSVLLLDVPSAIQGWPSALALNGGYAGAVCWPSGANQSAILQPFHMVDPEGTEVPAHWGVGLLPSAGAREGGTQISATVGFLGSHLRGMPNMILRSPQGAWVPQPPFLGPRNGVDDRAVPRPVTGGRGITRLAVIPGIEVTDEQGANPRTTNLAVGLSSSDRLYFIDEGDSANPVELGHWQAPGTLLYRIPAVDEVRKWVAMPVQQPEGLVWYVLSLRTPKTPTVIARLKGLGSYGAMSHGVLYTSGNGMLQAVDFGGEEGQGLRRQDAVPLKSKVGLMPIASSLGAPKCFQAPVLRIIKPSVTNPVLYINVDSDNGGAPVMKNVAIEAGFHPDTDGITNKVAFEWKASIQYAFKRRADEGGDVLLKEDFPKNNSQGYRHKQGGWSPHSLFQDVNGKDIVRGGIMEITVESERQKAVWGKDSENHIKILGVNPNHCDVIQMLDQLESNSFVRDWLKRIAVQESRGGYQFNKSDRGIYNKKGEPVQNDGGDGGMGMFQITIREIKDDSRRMDLLWRWDSNLIAAIDIFHEKLRMARAWPGEVEAWANKTHLIALNNYRKTKGKKPFAQIKVNKDLYFAMGYDADDALRGFNGYGQRDPETRLFQHEYFPKSFVPEESLEIDRNWTAFIVDNLGLVLPTSMVERITKFPFLLEVEESETDTLVGIVNKWDVYPLSKRLVGDPNYVNHLRLVKPMTCE